MSRGVWLQIFQKIRFHVVLNIGLNKLKRMPFYAVARGRNTGIFKTWAECEAQVKGFSGAKYKKFDLEESAHNFVTGGGSSAGPGFSNPKPTFSSNYNAQNSNIKRSHSTSSSCYQRHGKTSKKKTESTQEHFDSSFSEDDLETIVEELDKIEARATKVMKRSNCERSTILIEPPQPKRTRCDNKYEEDDEGYVQVYTDGACSANGRRGARAGIGVYWGEGHSHNVSEPVSGRATNNCGEIQAATRAIQQALQNGVKKLTINTDSQFLINSVTKWIPGWKRKGWRLSSGAPVKNEIDFKELDSLQNKLKIKWKYVEAHRGVHGNERADQLAKAGAALYNNNT